MDLFFLEKSTEQRYTWMKAGLIYVVPLMPPRALIPHLPYLIYDDVWDYVEILSVTALFIFQSFLHLHMGVSVSEYFSVVLNEMSFSTTSERHTV